MQKSENPILFYDWPNRLRNVAGGSRSAIKIDRPWQKEMAVSSPCPLCSKEGVAKFNSGDWKLMNNDFTPYSFHQMLVPKTCWPMEDVRSLGGEARFLAALTIIRSVANQSGIPKVFVSVHIGGLAGQNLNHLHYHLSDYSCGGYSESNTRSMILNYAQRNPDLVISEDDSLLAVVGGVKAGQCFIVPKLDCSLMSDPDRRLASMVTRVTELYNRRFRSIQGLSPDFSLCLILQNFQLDYVLYTPVLNHWGGAENIALYEPNCPIALPWPHEATVLHLLEK